MAPIAHNSVTIDASNGFKSGHASINQAWMMHGGLERSLACCTDRAFNGRRTYVDSQVFGVSIKSSNHGVLFKYAVKKPHLVIRALYSSGTAGSDGSSGDPKVQQMLVDMVRIQVGKTQMIEFVDERSQHLRNIADEALFEYDKIAYRTMKGLDATGSRVLRQLDADAIAIEKDLRIARAELEAQSRDFEEFQIRIAYSRNEGLFFKSLYRAPRALRYRSTLSKSALQEKVTAVTANSVTESSSGYRQILYGGLSLVMVSFLWSSSSALMAGTCMRASKLASYGVVFSLLLAQLAYFKAITGESTVVESKDEESK